MGNLFYEQLQKESDGTIQKMEWISVKDRLPECEQKVLVLFHRGSFAGITTGMYEDGTITEEDSRWSWEAGDGFEYDWEKDCYIIPEGWWEDKEFNSDDEYNHPIDSKVTHWMPLPKQPEEKPDEEENRPDA